MIVKLLTEHHLEFLSLKGGCRGSSESTLVKMPHCWKSSVTAHIYIRKNPHPISHVFQLIKLIRAIVAEGHSRTIWSKQFLNRPSIFDKIFTFSLNIIHREKMAPGGHFFNRSNQFEQSCKALVTQG